MSFARPAHLLPHAARATRRAALLSLLACSLALAGCISGGAPPLPSEGRRGFVGEERELPAVQREFRGVWVATVGNIDWPSKPGLPVEQQKAELIAILEHAQKLKLNAIIFQVRPACDAMYDSSLEPWSEYLTGTQGSAPEPFYDPLGFAVAQAHARGMELHAWFNPFRVKTKDSKATAAKNHISQTRPDLVRSYGGQLWLDPGEPDAQEYSLRVFADVIRRYDIDGIHIDDYFYPYRAQDKDKKTIPFPDQAPYERYQKAGGRLERNDWRRDNINRFVANMYGIAKRTRPTVQVGISPFGIWRPGNPAGIKGMDSYEAIYADSKLWLNKGWCDYFTPQLYWPSEPADQSYPALLSWWLEQNTMHRLIIPGNAAHLSKGRVPPSEMISQIRATRERGAAGNVFFSMKSLTSNLGGISDALAAQAYATPAVPPALPWLDDKAPPACDARAILQSDGGVRLAWRPPDLGERPFRWVIRMFVNDRWDTLVLPGGQYRLAVAPDASSKPPTVVAISAVDRLGNFSPPRVIRLDTAEE